MKIMLLVLWVLTLLALEGPSFTRVAESAPAPAQESTSNCPSNAPASVNEPPVEVLPGPGQASFRSGFEFWLPVLILGFGVLTFAFEYLLLRNRSFSGQELLRIVTISLILIATLFVISAGFNNNQIAPAMGLFGTIAGYLLGKGDKRVSAEKGEHK